MKSYQKILVCVTIIAIFVGIKCQQPTQNICGYLRIPCDDGDCITRSEWCDGELDCRDGSDEAYCKTKGYFSLRSPNTCTDKHFECKNGRCVPLSAYCDTYDNCGDYSDEDYCETSSEASSTTREEIQSASPSSFYSGYATTRSPVRTSHTASARDFSSSTSYYDRRYEDLHPMQRGFQAPPAYHVTSNRRTRTTTPYTTSSPTPYPRPSPPIARGPQNPNIVPRPGDFIYIPSRSVLNLPPTRPSYADRHKSQILNLPPFYFAKNYTENYDYSREVDEAKEWLVRQRDGSYSWGKDTARALIALSLSTNSFSSNITENYLMRKSLQTHLGIKLLRDHTGVENMTITRLAMYINAVLATCQNPSHFLGLNLVDKLYEKLRTTNQTPNPFSFLTLCLASETPYKQEVDYIQRLLLSSEFHSEISKDMYVLAMAALSCYSQRDVRDNHLRARLDEAVRRIVSQRNTADGSFGSMYTTALVAQVLMSINTTVNWYPKQTLDYIASHQATDGSFGNMLLTYYSIIALSGRSLVHLRNTHCDPVAEEKKIVSDCSRTEIMNRPGNMKRVLYTLRIGHPETFTVTQLLTVPESTDFIDLMCVARDVDPRYKYNYKVTNGLYGVYSVAGISNDPERGLFWSLYVLPHGKTTVDVIKDRYKEDMKALIPSDGEEVLFWYLPA